MSQKLIEIIESGSKEERESAAKEICQTRNDSNIDKLIKLLHNVNPEVREISAIILGVLGGKEAAKYLQVVEKNDPETNVRIAAIICKEYLGKTTFDNLRAEIRRFRGESIDEQKSNEKNVPKTKQTTAPKIKRVVRPNEHKDKNSNQILILLNQLWANYKLATIGLVLVILIPLIYFWGIENTETTNNFSTSSGQMSLAEIIQNRIIDTAKFKDESLNFNNPISSRPKTLELKSIAGDTYGELFDKVYSESITSEEGYNTLGAFWRHINFSTDIKQNLVDLMQMETEGELLLFPNFAAMSLKLISEPESISYQIINNSDPELEINIRVNEVIVR